MSELDRLVAHIRAGQRFFISSHQRPDGDAIGSAVAMALALRALGKHGRRRHGRRRRRTSCSRFPASTRSASRARSTETYDAALIMECSSLDRTGVAGLDRSPVLNIDHHLGNTRYGAINWVDESAAACSELVFTLIERARRAADAARSRRTSTWRC